MECMSGRAGVSRAPSHLSTPVKPASITAALVTMPTCAPVCTSVLSRCADQRSPCSALDCSRGLKQLKLRMSLHCITTACLPQLVTAQAWTLIKGSTVERQLHFTAEEGRPLRITCSPDASLQL